MDFSLALECKVKGEKERLGGKETYFVEAGVAQLSGL